MFLFDTNALNVNNSISYLFYEKLGGAKMSSTQLRVKELLRERGWTTKVLSEKTGMSESYLTHIKNGTRRWNEDSLRKIATAFDIYPVDLFVQKRSRTDNVDESVKLPKASSTDLQLKVVPVVGEIPANPSAYNNQMIQVTSGFKDVFVPVFNVNDDAMFCFNVKSNSMAPNFVKGDLLVISPESWTRSGDIAAVEYISGTNSSPIRAIMQVSYIDDFIVLESVNHKNAPVALVKGKDNFRVIGKVIYRYQQF
jgi:phage repressor protein C with HTH and peptisase S24 domain